MAGITKITIGIQARSTSHRYPGKIDQMIGDKTVLKKVLDSCFGAAAALNRYADTKRWHVGVALCIPFDDPIKYRYAGEASIIEGPEEDVLTRYVTLSEKMNSDYVVRITSDCPLITDLVIHKHITVAFMNRYDYTSNVDPRCRTAPDGLDCEVISKKLLDWASENAKDPHDREHVTTIIRREPPDFAKMGFIINTLDLSDMKISIDTKEDEKAIQTEYENLKTKIDRAEEIYGKKAVHRFS